MGVLRHRVQVGAIWTIGWNLVQILTRMIDQRSSGLGLRGTLLLHEVLYSYAILRVEHSTRCTG